MTLGETMSCKTALLATAMACAALPAAADATRWGGFTIGGSVAAVSSESILIGPIGLGEPGSRPRMSSTQTFGINAGYNWVLGTSVIVGVVGSYQSIDPGRSGIRALGAPAGPSSSNANLFDLGVRAGYAFGNTMLFAGIGAAQARQTWSYNGGAGAQTNGPSSLSMNAGVFSIGFQQALTPNMSWSFALSNYQFNAPSNGNSNGTPAVEMDLPPVTSLSVGVNWNF